MNRLAPSVSGSLRSTITDALLRRNKGDQPWSMVPSTYTRRKVSFGSWQKRARSLIVALRRRETDSTAMFLGRPRMRILLEASTESGWVAQHLETLGHEVIVVDLITHRCMSNEAGG